MNSLRRTAAALAVGAAAALALPAAAAHADTPSDESGDTTTSGTTSSDDGTQLSPASPLDLVLSTPGDLIGTLASGSPV